MSYTRYHATHRKPSVIFVVVVVAVVADFFYYDEGELQQQQQQHENINIEAIILKNIRRKKNYA